MASQSSLSPRTFQRYHNDTSLPGGDFTADVLGGRIDYGFSTRIFGSAFLRYNAALDQLVNNVRLLVLSAERHLSRVYRAAGRSDGGDPGTRVGRKGLKGDRFLARSPGLVK